MTHAAFRQLFYQKLTPNYLQGELQSLYHWCVQEIEGWSRVEAYSHNEEKVSPESELKWNKVISRLELKEPIQYVFNKAFFFDLELYVDSNVLIPRPETEELVELVLKREASIELELLDIGTGSGCIPLALKAARPYWKVQGCDISEDALKVARMNAATQKLPVEFFACDASVAMREVKKIDVVISNPPYIPIDRIDTVEDSVLNYEPKHALFAPANNPYYFFECIAKRAMELNAKRVYFETHATEMHALENVLRKQWKSEIEAVADISGKPRFLILSQS